MKVKTQECCRAETGNRKFDKHGLASLVEPRGSGLNV